VEHQAKLARHSLNWLRKHGHDKSAERMPAALRKLRSSLPEKHSAIREITQFIEAIRDRENPGRSYFKTLVQSLNKSAREVSSEIHITILEEGCMAIESQTKQSPASAKYAIPPLLVLGCRFGAEPLEAVKHAISPVLNDERLTIRDRHNLLAACQRFIEAGAFPSREMAEALLRDLGFGVSSKLEPPSPFTHKPE